MSICMACKEEPVPMDGMKCLECAAKSVAEWKLSKVATPAIPDKRKRRV